MGFHKMKFQVFQCIEGEMHLFGIQIESALFQVQVCSDKYSRFLFKENSINIFTCPSSFWGSTQITREKNESTHKTSSNKLNKEIGNGLKIWGSSSISMHDCFFGHFFGSF